MKILFLMQSPIYVGNFESTLRELARRGQAVEVIFEEEKAGAVDQWATIERLAREEQGLTVGPVLAARRGLVGLVRERCRRLEDYLRYLAPAYADSDALRRRAAWPLPAAVEARLTRALRGQTWAVHRIRELLRNIARHLPPSRAAEALLASRRPDRLVVTPLVQFGSLQADAVLAARRRGIASVLSVYSWDNLTNKALMHAVPDVVTVWNADQRREAMELHGVPASRIAVTGAPVYDQWFEDVDPSPRAEFLRRIGLASAHPLLLYVCSSKFVAPDELAFVRGWLAALRASDSEARSAAVLVRPHPLNASQWVEADLSGLGEVAVFPRTAVNPAEPEARADYRDSLAHAAAVVGINTSALIEAAIMDRPVLTVRDSAFRLTQDGTLHFRLIADPEDGVLLVADDLPAHLAQLEKVLANPSEGAARRSAFVERFVRPAGLEVPATARVADAVERVVAPIRDAIKAAR